MKTLRLLILFLLLLLSSVPMRSMQGNRDCPKAMVDLLDRIGGEGTGSRILTRLDRTMGEDGKDVFCISAEEGKPLIAGSSLTAIGTGINWYLNHYAHINLSWNQLTTDLSGVALPVPTKEERHTCRADYRYYLNYCTFGYSMCTWTWERWEQEIDWMVLHGINMPLQIVGLEMVWYRFLTEDCHYTRQQAEAFIPGPAYTPWWGMNNLEGWGRPNLENEEESSEICQMWYKRQAELGRRIGQRQRELGMQPVLPGFSGMVPSNFQHLTGIHTEKANLWCQFQRPTILDPTLPEFQRLAQQYYIRLKEVMGSSQYYSMDPFHEGGIISSKRYSEGYKAVFDALSQNCGTSAKWVIQQWQWADYQATSLTAVPPGRLIVLDLFSDGHPAFEAYNGYAPQDAVYCTIPNFGGRTGFMGRLPRMAEAYFDCVKRFHTLKGIGSAPEAIESVPVVYDLLYELPWMDQQPNMETWIKDYATSRYGIANSEAQEAWKGILQTAMNERTRLQGPHETVMCARPSLTVDKVSSWGGATVFYDQKLFLQAVEHLVAAAALIGTKGSLGAENMCYDVTDLVRQVMSDHSQTLLGELRESYETGHMLRFYQLRKDFTDLILDTDRFLGTNRMFRLGHWTESARCMAREVLDINHINGQEAQRWEKTIADWLEYDNARQLITTWGDHQHAEQGGLRDYSYRQWQGMLKDYYLPRWNYFLRHRSGNLSTPETGWFPSEWNWAHELKSEWGARRKGKVRKTNPQHYSEQPEGDTYTIALELLGKYL